jgi:hypothetical protein
MFALSLGRTVRLLEKDDEYIICALVSNRNHWGIILLKGRQDFGTGTINDTLGMCTFTRFYTLS